MCGRYALGIRAAFVRHRLQQENMPVDDWAEDDEARETYNFAPGYNGLVYRANVADTGTRAQEQDGDGQGSEGAGPEVEEAERNGGDGSTHAQTDDVHATKETDSTYRLQAMKWGELRDNSTH